MKRVSLFFICLCCIHAIGKSQVNLQTGSATFGLPLFNWQDDRSRLNAAVALNYSSGSGLRVSDVSSNIGQGWNLIAGGSIMRMQIGEPDDQKPREGAFNDITKYPAGIMYNDVPAADGCPSALMRYPIYKSKNEVYKQHNSVAADREYDQFAFQFNGRSGMFILPKFGSFSTGDLNRGMVIGDSRLKIWYFKDETTASSLQCRTTIMSFHIQDENGLLYKFTKLEMTKVLRTKYCSADLQHPLTQPTFEAGNVYHETSYDGELVNPYVVTGWHLTEIEDVLTGRKINLTYENRTINTISGVALSSTQKGTVPNQSWKWSGYTIVSHGVSKSVTPVIKSISFPDGHLVSFNYGVNRVDLVGDQALASIDIEYNNRFLSKYALNTSYFILNRIGKPLSAYQKANARLCLRSIQKFTYDLLSYEPPYVFDYYTGSSVADDFVPGANTVFKDIWGYYNGSNSKAVSDAAVDLTKSVNQFTSHELAGLCFIRDAVSPAQAANHAILNPKAGYAKNGLLKKITYPTGGTIQYEYAQNTGVINSQTINVGGVHVSTTKATDGGYSNDCNNPLVSNYLYVLAGSSLSSLWGLEKPENEVITQNYYNPEDKFLSYKPLLNFSCKYRYVYPGIMSREQAIALTSMQQFMVTFSKVMDVVSAVMQVIDIVSLCLKATPAAIVAVILDVVASLVNVGLTCFNNPAETRTSNIYYNMDINGSNPLPVQFKRVEIVEGNGTNGKTVSEFTSSDDYPIWEATNPAMSKKQRFAPWAYGLLKNTTIYDAAGNPVKQTLNTYNYMNAKRTLNYVYTHFETMDGLGVNTTYIKAKSCKCYVEKSSSQRNDVWEDPNVYTANYLTSSVNDMEVDLHDIYSGRVELSETKERVYKQNSSTDYAEVTSAFTYHYFYLFMTGTTVTESGGDTYRKAMNYAVTGSSTISNTLRANNIITMPSGTAVYFTKAGSNTEKIISENSIELTQLLTGDIKPYRDVETRYPSPNGIGVTAEAQRFYYNADGLAIGVKDEGDRTITSIYGYNQKQVIASVINAHPVDDKTAYSSFEVNGELGGWTAGSGNSYSFSNAITGNRCYYFNSGRTLTAALTSTKANRLSFWANAGHSLSISGATATLDKTGPVRNGLTYYEYTLAQGATYVAISGVGYVDELRVYPKNARMRTVAYDPIVGKTAECDENNRLVYYTYDDRGRLRMIKDEEGSVVKMYEYNERKTPGCAGTYSNLAVSEIYQKNNCAPGYIGTFVVYTIPEGTYTSAVSQDEVDILVENDLNTNGQAYANTNGSCLQVFYSAALSASFTKENCPIGYVGSTVTYSIPYGRYTSTVNQLAADAQAQVELDANGQAYANAPGVGTCSINTEPEWEGTGNEQCTNNHKWREIKDINPNSSTYNTTQWIDMGPATCDVNGGLNSPQWEPVQPFQSQCEQVNGANTGYYLVFMQDMNPASSSYNTTQWFNVGYYPDQCPLACTNCLGDNKKCISGVCETGIKVYTSSYQDYVNGELKNICVYHYEWSDNTWSVDYYEYYEPWQYGCITP